MNPLTISVEPLKILMLQHLRSYDNYTAARTEVVLCVCLVFFPRATLPYVFKLNEQAIY